MPGKRQLARFLRWWLPGCAVFLLVAFQSRPLVASDLTQAVQTVLDEAQHQYAFPGATAAYVLPTADGVMAWHPGFEWTGGGLVSNARDLAVWGVALFGGQAMPGAYLDDLLQAVSVSPDSDDVQYGSGVAMYRSGPFGPVYGHGGWIPGYSSSLRYYADYDVAIAFQINTDIGIVDDTIPVVPDLEFRLAERVLEGRVHLSAHRPGSWAAPLSGDPVPMRFAGQFLIRGDRITQP